MTADAVGGVWQYAVDLSSALVSRGVDVTLAVMGPPPSTTQRDEARTHGLSLTEGEYRLEWMEDPWQDVTRAGEWLIDLEDRIRPDVVHLNGYAHGALPWRAAPVVVAHSCVRSWWRAVHGSDAPASWDRYSRAVADGLRAARLVVAPTQDMLNAIHDHYGPLGDSCVIPNGRAGVELAPPDPESKSAIVFSAGRLWDPAKNVETLCAAAPHLSWPVYVAGEAAPAACATGGDSGGNCVHRLGRLTSREVREWCARASIYALPARYEPFGLSVLEAAACGCALVLGDIASLRENWSGAALFVRPDDSRALGDTIERLIADPAQRRSLGSMAVTRAREFTVERMTNAYLRAYERALTPAPLVA
jgi:glycogen synthase